MFTKRDWFVWPLGAVIGVTFNAPLLFGWTWISVIDQMLLAALFANFLFATFSILLIRTPSDVAPISTLAMGLVSVGGAMLAIVLFYSECYKLLGVSDGGVISHDLTDALYLSVMTWTTVGFGDVVPVAGMARRIASAEAMNSYFAMGMALAVVISVIGKIGEQTDDVIERPTRLRIMFGRVLTILGICVILTLSLA